MDLQEFSGRLDDLLDIGAYADEDPSSNGLQVGPPAGTVDHVAFAVDGVTATFEAAAEAGVDAMVVHHGLSWGGFDRITGRTYERVAALVENEIALYVAHLPLDGHPELGNAARLASYLDLEVSEPFGQVGTEHVGQQARAVDSRTVDGLRDRLADLERVEIRDTGEGHAEGTGTGEGTSTGRERVQVLAFGPDRIEDVGIVTGAGTDWIDEARENDLDALVTGEGKQQAYHAAMEAGLHVFLAGHYATETVGVRTLREVVSEWGLDTTYVSHPTGI